MLSLTTLTCPSTLTMLVFKLILLVTKVFVAARLTCKQVQEASKKSLGDLQSISAEDMVECLLQLNANQITKTEAEFMWQSIEKHYGGASNIPEKTLEVLGTITAGILPEQYVNLTLASIEVIENFGRNYNLNEEQLAAIADRVRSDFSNKLPSDYTVYDLQALGQILCAFNRSEIAQIHLSAYKEAAVRIGQLKNCNGEVLSEFAILAVQKDAFGPPERWSRQDISAVGVVADFLPKGVRDALYIQTNRSIHN